MSICFAGRTLDGAVALVGIALRAPPFYGLGLMLAWTCTRTLRPWTPSFLPTHNLAGYAARYIT